MLKLSKVSQQDSLMFQDPFFHPKELDIRLAQGLSLQSGDAEVWRRLLVLGCLLAARCCLLVAFYIMGSVSLYDGSDSGEMSLAVSVCFPCSFLLLLLLALSVFSGEKLRVSLDQRRRTLVWSATHPANCSHNAEKLIRETTQQNHRSDPCRVSLVD